ncbi:MAG: GGDEF domain-containing protein [Candidatus Izemoplasmataceae bacterium]
MNRNYEYFLSQYNLDVLNDVLSKKDQHIEFVFDIKKKPVTLYLIKGDITLLGLPNKKRFVFNELLPYVETDNALAEIEGKRSFNHDLVKKIYQMNDDLYVFIPLRASDKTLWLTVGFYTLLKKDNKPSLIHGKIHRVSYETPLEITYYKKAYQDELTGLFTRETLKLHFEKPIVHEDAYGLYIDLDHFKTVNDQYGHKMGNVVLQQIAEIFINQWEKNVIYYRLGGDEFFVFIWNHSIKDLEKRAKWIINIIENLSYKGIKFNISASIGIVPINKGMNDYATILDLSDEAMYQIKRSGPGQYNILI